jgi:hypothetical protein
VLWLEEGETLTLQSNPKGHGSLPLRYDGNLPIAEACMSLSSSSHHVIVVVVIVVVVVVGSHWWLGCSRDQTSEPARRVSASQ